MKVSIVLPTYNERGNIIELIEAIEQVLESEEWDHELVVVDDNSPDGTAEVVREYARANRPPIELIVRLEERGLATAIRCGIERSQGDVLLVMDTDFNHDPKMIPQMVEFLKYYDLVIGSRFVMGGGMESLMRYYLSFLFNVLVRLILRTQIQDNLSGFFSIRRSQLIRMDLDRIFYGYGDYFMRLLWTAWNQRLRMIEVPVFYALRRHGSSKSNFVKMLANYTTAVLTLRLTRGHWRKGIEQEGDLTRSSGAVK